MCEVLREAGESEERREREDYTVGEALDLRNLWFEFIPYKTKSELCFEQVQGSPYPSGCSLYSRAKVLGAALWTSLLCLYVLFT